jgi:hypothetical protein
MGNVKKLLSSLAALGVVLVLVFSGIISTRANPGSVIDFEGIPEGAIVSSVYSGFGISGDVVSGVVTVFGFNPLFGPDVNAAMIFDAACLPGGTPASCTGGDNDLFLPGDGNVLIISEDLDSSDPDDADLVGAVFEFDFSGWGSGSVTVESIDVLDVETEEQGAAKIHLFSGGIDGTIIDEVIIPETGNGNFMTVTVDVSGVDAMRVDLDGSGAITNVSIFPDDIPTATPTNSATPTPTNTPPPINTPTPTPTATQTPTPTPTQPTAVKLLYFRTAEVDGQQVTLEWATAAEIDHYEFRLYRSAAPDFGQAGLIYSVPSTGNVGGKSYQYSDTLPAEGDWWYWLTDIDTHGQETLDDAFNPVHVAVNGDFPSNAGFQIFLPISIADNQP